jgi:hypothetical protein
LAPGQVAQLSKDAIKNDPKFVKYSRMASVGVPLDAIRNKMAQDGLSQEDVAVFLGAYTSTTTMQGELPLWPGAKKHSSFNELPRSF